MLFTPPTAQVWSRHRSNADSQKNIETNSLTKMKTTWIVGRKQTTTREVKFSNGYRRLPVIAGVAFSTKKEAEEFRRWDGSQGMIVAPASAEYVAAKNYVVIGIEIITP